jgi:putative transposase
LAFGSIRKYLENIFHDLVRREGVVIEELHLMGDHVHIRISIPPKYSVASVVGYLKDKNAVSIARNFKGRHRNFVGEQF